MQHQTSFQDGILSATLSESFTFNDNQAFRGILQEITTHTVSNIRIDVSGLEFIDSAALGMLLLLRDTAQKKRASVTLKGAQGHVKKMFDTAKFSQLFTLE